MFHFRHLCDELRLKPCQFPSFYPRIKAKLSSWRAQAVWAKVRSQVKFGDVPYLSTYPNTRGISLKIVNLYHCLRQKTLPINMYSFCILSLTA